MDLADDRILAICFSLLLLLKLLLLPLILKMGKRERGVLRCHRLGEEIVRDETCILVFVLELAFHLEDGDLRDLLV